MLDFIVPMPQVSTAAAEILCRLGITAGIVHLDASHGYEDILRDTEAYWPLVDPGGFLVGDDYGEAWVGVTRAADEFAARLGTELVIEAPKWIVQKP